MSNESNSQQELHSLEGEGRGMPMLHEGGPSTAKRGLIVVLVLLVLALAAAAGYWKYTKNRARIEAEDKQKNLQLSSAVPARTFTDPPTRSPASGPGPAAAVPVVPAASPGAAPPLPGSGVAGTGTAASRPPQVLDKAGSPLMVGDANPAKPVKPSESDPSNDQMPPAGQGGMSALLSSTRAPSRMAGTLGNRNFILAKGGFINCALQTKLDSTVPGMTACVVTRNIYSDNNKVLLIERGSTVTGEYQSNLRQGMARIFVLWSRIKTPNGITIALDSPGSDALGGAGVPGYVDNHFWQRFGGALMLSLVDDVARGLTSNGSGSGGQQNFNLGSTGDATQNMAAEALKNTINIPPTLYKNQGEEVGIYVARDLNFSGVYDVTTQ
jgi:type IV secretion system protein VirB10